MKEHATLYMTYLQQPDYFYPILFVLGLVIGSFLNVVIYRLPRMLEQIWYHDCVSYLINIKNEGRPDLVHQTIAGDQTLHIETIAREQASPAPTFNLFLPSSHCPACKHKLHFWENIPVLSYVYLLGRCSECRAPIPIRYLGIELFTAVITLIVGFEFGLTLQLPFALLLTYGLIAVTFIDIDKQILPDSITLLGLWVGLLLSVKSVFVGPTEAILGAAAGYLGFWLVYWAFKIFTHKEGLGYGDFKLLALAGAWLGWQYLPFVVFIASLTGTVYGVASLSMKITERGQPIPFGPFLALGIWLTLIMGDHLLTIYSRWVQ